MPLFKSLHVRHEKSERTTQHSPRPRIGGYRCRLLADWKGARQRQLRQDDPHLRNKQGMPRTLHHPSLNSPLSPLLNRRTREKSTTRSECSDSRASRGLSTINTSIPARTR